MVKTAVVVKVYCLWLRLLLLLKFTFDVKGDTFENPYLTWRCAVYQLVGNILMETVISYICNFYVNITSPLLAQTL